MRTITEVTPGHVREFVRTSLRSTEFLLTLPNAGDVCFYGLFLFLLHPLYPFMPGYINEFVPQPLNSPLFLYQEPRYLYMMSSAPS